jgi:mannose-6-phosphate isomerase-like protein (cupin superfamily)
MMSTTDPRAALKTSGATPSSTDGIAAPEYRDFSQAEPDEVTQAGSRTWFFRGQNFVQAYTRLAAGDTLDREEQQEEYVVLLVGDAVDVTITADGQSENVTERAVVVVPPGRSSVAAGSDCDVVRLFDHRTADVLAKASNAESYAAPHPRVAPLEPWPEPVGGRRLRVYSIDRVPAEPGRFGRIFRTSSFMVNFLDLQEGPRDPEKLSPHHHDDFEQCSLAVEGAYVHHIRTPWTAKQSQWREDEHERVGSPSVAIIPPPTVHTSAAVGEGRNQLIDIFCPPREDFSAQQGWVLNAEDYPAPASS